jgi:hypothetical protein
MNNGDFASVKARVLDKINAKVNSILDFWGIFP